MEAERLLAIASNAMRGRLDQAGRALTLHLRVDPKLTVARVCEFYPLRREADRQRLIEAMRRAGAGRRVEVKHVVAPAHVKSA